MAKRQYNKANKFETSNLKVGFVRLYSDLLLSPAWNRLTNRARNLYIMMLYARYHQSKEEKQYILDQYPGQSAFFFSVSRWYDSKEYEHDQYHLHLYTNKNHYYTDKKMLIETGFISVLEDNHHRKEKNIYTFSDRWKE